MNKQEVQSLSLTSEYFELLLKALEKTFKKKHSLKRLPKSMQYFGYGNYNSLKPNLKSDLEQIGSDFINGKYLYDKVREFHKGKSVIKLNQYYKSIVLLYLGFENVEQFLEKNRINGEAEKSQLSLVYGENDLKTYYYLNYYFGEDGVIQKGKTIISNNWKKIKNTYRYPDKEGNYKEFYDFGSITIREDAIFIRNKTMLNGKLVEGASEIIYIGQNNPAHLKYLIGCYSTFDLYNNSVAGRFILEKCESEEDMEIQFDTSDIPPYIAMEIRNQRIVNKTIVPKHFLEISKNSPYAAIYKSITGTYELTLNLPSDRTEIFKFKILSENYKMIPLDENVYFERDNLELLNKGSVVYFSFDLTGVVAFDRLDMYFKTYYLKEGNLFQDGVYSGVDNENRLVSGEVRLSFKNK
jgi:hypothetical protein